MSLLTLNTLPAERARGCIFVEKFENSQKVIDNEGVITSTPIIDSGVTFNGTDEFITYPSLLNIEKSDYSIICKCTPVGATNDWFGIIDTFVSPNRISLFISSDNKPYIHIGSTFAESSGSGDIPRDEEITLGVSVDRNSTISFYLNGVLHGTGTGTTPNDYLRGDNFIIGARGNGTDHFWDGNIKEIYIYKGIIFTAQEHLDYYNDIWQDYLQKNSLDLSFVAEHNDVDNLRTLDNSNNNYHAEFGDGSTPTTYPTKLQNRGYSFDSTTDRLTISDTSNLRFDASTEDFTLALLVKPNAEAGDAYLISKEDANDDGWTLYHSGSPNTIQLKLNSTTVSSNGIISDGKISSVIISIHRDGNAEIYLDGELDNTGSASGITMATTSDITIGNRSYDVSNGFNGEIYNTLIFNFALTPIQVKDLHIRLLQEVNNV